jgi:hypothetical protein
LAESIWVGRDEHEGVPAQPRKDLEPPPHWRLEAIARTPRPRSPWRLGSLLVRVGEAELDVAEPAGGFTRKRH